MDRDSESCRGPIPFETLSDYLSGELAEAGEREQELEAHLFSCRPCSEEAQRLGGLVSAVATAVPYILSSSRFAALERSGRIEHVNTMAPDQTVDVHFPEPGRLLVHRLRGADLKHARRVDVTLSDTRGEPFAHLENVPFDGAQGEVFAACQTHFADRFPHDVVFSVETVSEDERAEVARYTVLHQRRA